MYFLLRYLPKNHLSALVGYVSRLDRFPRFQRLLISWFVKRYGVRVEDMARPLTSYACLGELFTRELRPGIRPVSGAIVSPVDGRLTEAGVLESDTIIQAKGKSYSLAALLGSEESAKTFLRGHYFVFYLAPGDYHRIHSPVAGNIRQIIHIPGALWPVNTWSIENIDGLFSKNERLISMIASDTGQVAVVKVGATNVGRISSAVCSIRTNRLDGQKAPEVRDFNPVVSIECGEHLGTFEMGSTVVLLFEPGMIPASAEFRMGVSRFGAPFFE